MADDISLIHLKKVADRIGNQWMTLGVNLGIPYHTLQNISSPAQGGPTQYGARMMNHWRQKNARLTHEEVRQAIVTALQEAGRMDLAREVQTSRMAEAADIEKVFQKISPSLTREWRDVGIYLDLGFSELDSIKAQQPLENDPRKEMLEIWYKQTLRNRRGILTTALEDLKRLDIVNEIGGPTGTPAPNQAESSGFFQQSLPQVPTDQPGAANRGTHLVNQTPLTQAPMSQAASAIPQPQSTTGGPQPMSNAGAQSLPSHHSVEAWPAGTPRTDIVQDQSLQSFRQYRSVETSLQHQQAQAAANRQPRHDLASADTHSIHPHNSVDGRMIAQPTDACSVEGLNSYQQPSF